LQRGYGMRRLLRPDAPPRPHPPTGLARKWRRRPPRNRPIAMLLTHPVWKPGGAVEPFHVGVSNPAARTQEPRRAAVDNRGRCQSDRAGPEGSQERDAEGRGVQRDETARLL